MDPAGVVTYDWVHTFLQGGVLNHEVESLLIAARGHDITRRQIQDFLKNEWKFPNTSRQKQSALYRVFDSRRVSTKAPDALKCNCSELLGLYGMLRYICRRHGLLCQISTELKRPVASSMQALTLLSGTPLHH